jgi:hypothetical protein
MWGWAQDTCKKWSQGFLEREWLRIAGARQVFHVEGVLSEVQDVGPGIGAEAGNQGGRDRVARLLGVLFLNRRDCDHPAMASLAA